ncbi:MAG: hypothetical protein R3B99_06915 [Polyangiales bacterium]
MYDVSRRLFPVLLMLVGVFPSAGDAARGPSLHSSSGDGAVDLRVGEAIDVEVRWNGRPLPAGARVRWLELAPRPEHVELTPPSPPYRTYSNAQLGGPRHGRWIGQDVLEGDVLPLAFGEAAGSRWRWTPERPGTRWLAAEVTLADGTVARTPASFGRGGVDPRAMRVSVREDDSFVGWLAAYFGVPYVFGSTPAQSESFRGIDCADVMVAAQRRASGRALGYVSVQGLERHAEPVGDAFEVDAEGAVTRGGEPALVRFGQDVARGDLLAIDYADDPDGQLPRPWDHVGAVLEDRGPSGAADGLLGPDDLIRHMGLRGLMDEPLRRHGHVRLRVWRWR